MDVSQPCSSVRSSAPRVSSARSHVQVLPHLLDTPTPHPYLTPPPLTFFLLKSSLAPFLVLFFLILSRHCVPRLSTPWIPFPSPAVVLHCLVHLLRDSTKKIYLLWTLCLLNNVWRPDAPRWTCCAPRCMVLAHPPPTPLCPATTRLAAWSPVGGATTLPRYTSGAMRDCVTRDRSANAIPFCVPFGIAARRGLHASGQREQLQGGEV